MCCVLCSPAEVQGGRQEPGEGGGVHDGEGDGEGEQEVGEGEARDQDVARGPQLGQTHGHHHCQVTRHCKQKVMLFRYKL